MRADRRGSNGCRELKCPLRETIFSVCGVHLNVTELLETAVTGGAVPVCLGAGGQVSVSESFGFLITRDMWTDVVSARVVVNVQSAAAH